MALTVIGIFDDASEAQQAVDQLVSAGISRNNIDLSARTGEYTDADNDSGVGGFFSSLFGSNDDADTKRYSQVASRGSVITVHAGTEAEAERAADVLDDAGAVDVNERAAQYETGSSGMTTAPVAGAITDTARPTDADQTIKVIEENLAVGKRTVETGGVRLRSRIVSKPVEESVRLREERVSVQRTPVSRPATAADLDAFQEGEITMTESAEVPVVSKTANVVEEISVGKDVSERQETIRDTVRKTEVDIEDMTGRTQRTGQTGLDADDVTYSTQK